MREETNQLVNEWMAMKDLGLNEKRCQVNTKSSKP